ncbi:MAG: hypothetical protein ACUVRZ_00035 [Desulfobacca sp.]|uniref:hypothetical protein n=1 Tax=Desulfobacca sp. TaxID=2067990 RepID=UPI00404B34F2
MTDIAAEQLLELDTEALHRLPPPRLWALVQDLCRRWGIYGQSLTLRHEGEEYLVACQEHAFTVYRRVAMAATPHATPGWPVCLVSAEHILDECTPPLEEQDHFACHLNLADWLTLIQQACSGE